MDLLKKEKFLPKIKKKIKSFLTDESGKITKKNALGVGAIGSLVVASDAQAWSHSSATSYANWGGVSGGHFNGSAYAGGHANTTLSGGQCHLSGLVYGHLNQAYGVLANPDMTSHGSHSSSGY